jgi:hypothetical protein
MEALAAKGRSVRLVWSRQFTRTLESGAGMTNQEVPV